ncbi:hypothetical protein DID88_008135 [Monilinia fructigena]|uniref:Rhodopsin domain-containing protein n=1 Tax=Monilinia fructigena TaxID=38457 RepID=A0A395J9J1_9HELO|nr:hypothetical protein DID88_008135 [Monilinia fructigena]
MQGAPSYSLEGLVIFNELIPGTVLPVVAVVLRFWSRSVNSPVDRKSRFWWDDWLVLIALPLCIAQNATLLYWTSIGLGRHLVYIQPVHIETGLIILFSNYFFWPIGVTLAKFSVLCLYARIFNVNYTFRIALWITGAINLAWTIFVIISGIFQCTPVKKAWKPLLPGHCIDFYAWYIAIAATSFFVDLIILILPMPLLFKLRLSLTRKVCVTLLFLLGYTVIAFSIGRLVVIRQIGPSFIIDLTYNMVPLGRWLVIETPMCIVSVCLPAVFTLIKRLTQNGPSSLFTSKSYDSQNPSVTNAQYKGSVTKDTESMTRIHERDLENSVNEYSISDGNEGHDYYAMATTIKTKGNSK